VKSFVVSDTRKTHSLRALYFTRRQRGLLSVLMRVVSSSGLELGLRGTFSAVRELFAQPRHTTGSIDLAASWLLGSRRRCRVGHPPFRIAFETAANYGALVTEWLAAERIWITLLLAFIRSPCQFNALRTLCAVLN
jgi:hypothetical protein